MDILKTLYCVAETDNPDPTVFRQQIRQRIFIRQKQFAQPLAVAGKFKRDLRQIHAAKIRTVRRRNRFDPNKRAIPAAIGPNTR